MSAAAQLFTASRSRYNKARPINPYNDNTSASAFIRKSCQLNTPQELVVAANTDVDASIASQPLYMVKTSTIHGTGIFARSTIEPGACIVEYQGERILWEVAQDRADADGPLNHTYFFSLNDGRIIDGGSGGNEARFINHSCEPNCEAVEHDDGRVYIYSVQEIAAGEELSYDYALIFEERHTPAVKKAFACYCGAPTCSGSMLMPKRSARYRAQQALSK